MKIMKTIIAALLLIPAIAFAGIDSGDLGEFNNLSDTDKAAIILQIAEMREKVEPAPLPTAETLEKWADVGTKYGKMLGGIANELGIAANEFATTPVGIISTVVVVWHFLGEDFTEMMVSMGWFATMIPLWVYLFFRSCYAITGYKTIKKNTFFRGVVECEVPTRAYVSDASAGSFVAAAIIIVIVGLILLA